MRPGHWRFTIPLRLRSLFRWAQLARERQEVAKGVVRLKACQHNRKIAVGQG